MKVIKGLVGILILGLFIVSCGDDNEPIDVNVKLQMKVGEELLTHGTTYRINDTDVQFTNVAFYLGDMKFETSDGVTYESGSRYHLIKPGIFDFGFSIPADKAEENISLSTVSFFVGVDPDTNAEEEVDFTQRAEGDPLGQQNPTMHWGWAGGYRFMNIDGNADVDGDGEFETQLTYHLGFDEFLKSFSVNLDLDLEGGQNDFQIIFDMNGFLSDVDFETEFFTKVQPDNRTLADKLYDNYDSTFNFAK